MPSPTDYTITNIGMIILAAGNSSRLGRPKQLIPFRGLTLLTHVITESQSAGLHPIVVTGAYREEVEESLENTTVHQVYNAAWQTGMASGIVAGLSKLLSANPGLDAVIIAVCDQPFISAELLSALIATFLGAGKQIVASTYAGSAGTPVLFGSSLFGELLALSGAEGAKKLLTRHPDQLAAVAFPEGAIDIDTEDDAGTLEA